MAFHLRALFLGGVLVGGVLFASMSRPATVEQQDTPPTLMPILARCEKLTYKPAPDPKQDQIAQLVNGRKRYRLVIGTDRFSQADPVLNRPFVATTAGIVDAHLDKAGYQPVDFFQGKPYLVGAAATKAQIRAAVQELARKATGKDVGIVYFIGHGTLTPSHTDLALSVFDRPVEGDEGIRLSDIVGYLTVGQQWVSSVEEIPHFIIVLETCYSGNAIETTGVVTVDGVQRLVKVETVTVPESMAMLAATADGDTSRAYELRDSGMSAFGYFFSLALSEDRDCADSTPDGILTLNEVFDYVRRSLAVASAASRLDGPMVPVKLNRDDHAFVTYSPDKIYVAGERDSLGTLTVDQTPGTNTQVRLENGFAFQCPPTCTGVTISKKLDQSLQITQAVRTSGRGRGGAASLPDDVTPPSLPKTATIKLGDVFTQHQLKVLDTTVSVLPLQP
jgi:hypothetical protein